MTPRPHVLDDCWCGQNHRGRMEQDEFNSRVDAGEDPYAVVADDRERYAATPSRPKRSAAAIRREHLPALAAIHERILGDIDLCHALEVVMVMAGYLTEEASNPMGAYWHGDAPDA